MCSVAESAIDHGSFETTGICISVGIAKEEKTTAIGLSPSNHSSSINHEGSDHLSSSSSSSSHHNASHFNHHANKEVIIENKDTLSTVLSKEVAFLQFDGRSTVDVDETGIFISIPTFDNEDVTTTLQSSSSSSSSTFSSVNSTTTTKKTKRINNFKTSRRGLRIPASSGLKVSCAQPLSLVLTVPIKQETSSSSLSSSSSSMNVHETEHQQQQQQQQQDNDGTDESMRRFLSSSTVQIPWTYEGHNHSPEAYADLQNESLLSVEEKEQMLKDLERDSIIFASTVCSLAEFISSLPEGTEELCICFSCSDRLIRDTLVLSIRGLVALPSDFTRHERKKVFPWISDNGEVLSTLIAENNESDKELQGRLMILEETNNALKKERNELTIQLVEAREEVVTLKGSKHIYNNYRDEGNNNDNINNSSSSGSSDYLHTVGDVAAHHDSSDQHSPIDNISSVHHHHDDDDASGGGGGSSSREAFKQLSRKIIELENQLSIANKREVIRRMMIQQQHYMSRITDVI